MSPADVVLVLVLAPALAALVGLPLGRVDRRLAVACGVGGTLVSLLAALWLARETWDGYPYVTAVPFLGRVDTGIAPDTSALDLRVDSLGGLVSVAVTLVALGVQVYSAGYLRRAPDDADPAPTRYPAYAATVSLFTAAMLLVVQADDLFLVLVGWEVMGICSYLLVGHHSERPAARRAAVQAFLVTRVGDVAFVIGIIVLYAATGTSQIGRVVAQVDEIGTGTATLAALLLVVGVMGKSAQFPFHGWLPDAMEGPTPVSALIHAATMVAAGVVVLARLQALLEAAPVALAALAVVATVTMVGAGFAALVADDIKRVLAWSTISQVAIMLGALSLGSDAGRASALAHLLSHAAFKSLLFLAAGVLAHLAGTTLLSGIHSMGRRAPWTTAAWVVGLLSLAALPPFAGFLSKEGVLTAAEHGALDGDGSAPSWVAATLLVGVGLTSVLTGAYAGRLLAVTVRRPPAAEPVWDETWEDEVEDGVVGAVSAAGEDDYDLVFAIDPEYHPEDYVAPSPAERERALRLAAERARREEARREAERQEAERVQLRLDEEAAAKERADEEDRVRGGPAPRGPDDGPDRRGAHVRHPRRGGAPARRCPAAGAGRPRAPDRRRRRVPRRRRASHRHLARTAWHHRPGRPRPCPAASRGEVGLRLPGGAAGAGGASGAGTGAPRRVRRPRRRRGLRARPGRRRTLARGRAAAGADRRGHRLPLLGGRRRRGRRRGGRPGGGGR